MASEYSNFENHSFEYHCVFWLASEANGAIICIFYQHLACADFFSPGVSSQLLSYTW